jgi:prepilin signal peptidase PulO-like enzyme (type II secretory pathway)
LDSYELFFRLCVAGVACYLLNALRVFLPDLILDRTQLSLESGVKTNLQLIRSYLSLRSMPIWFMICIYSTTILQPYIWGKTSASNWILLFSYLLITLAWIDAATELLPDFLTLPLIWLGLFLSTQNIFNFVTYKEALCGVIGTYLILTITVHIYRNLRGADGLGYGDIKLFCAVSAWLGYANVLIILLLACSLHLSYFFINHYGRLAWKKEIPFGPSIVVAVHLYLLILLAPY